MNSKLSSTVIYNLIETLGAELYSEYSFGNGLLYRSSSHTKLAIIKSNNKDLLLTIELYWLPV